MLDKLILKDLVLHSIQEGCRDKESIKNFVVSYLVEEQSEKKNSKLVEKLNKRLITQTKFTIAKSKALVKVMKLKGKSTDKIEAKIKGLEEALKDFENPSKELSDKLKLVSVITLMKQNLVLANMFALVGGLIVLGINGLSLYLFGKGVNPKDIVILLLILTAVTGYIAMALDISESKMLGKIKNDTANTKLKAASDKLKSIITKARKKVS